MSQIANLRLMPHEHQTSARLRFAANMRASRLEKGYSQETLAGIANLHRNYIGSVERGERNVAIDNMEAIAKALDCTIIDLLAVCD